MSRRQQIKGGFSVPVQSMEFMRKKQARPRNRKKGQYLVRRPKEGGLFDQVTDAVCIIYFPSVNHPSSFAPLQRGQNLVLRRVWLEHRCNVSFHTSHPNWNSWVVFQQWKEKWPEKLRRYAPTKGNQEKTDTQSQTVTQSQSLSICNKSAKASCLYGECHVGGILAQNGDHLTAIAKQPISNNSLQIIHAMYGIKIHLW